MSELNIIKSAVRYYADLIGLRDMMLMVEIVEEPRSNEDVIGSVNMPEGSQRAWFKFKQSYIKDFLEKKEYRELAHVVLHELLHLHHIQYSYYLRDFANRYVHDPNCYEQHKAVMLQHEEIMTDRLSVALAYSLPLFHFDKEQ